MSSTTNQDKKRKAPASENDVDAELLSTEEKLKKELLETKQKLAAAEGRAKKAEALVESMKAKMSNKESRDESSDDDASHTDDDDMSDPWTLKYKELREYRMIHGDCKVSEKGKYPQLGQWVTNQKRKYGNTKTGKKGTKLAQEKIDKLDRLGMFWGKAFPEVTSWESRFEELAKYQKAMGHCNIHISSTDPSALAKWVSYQRSEYQRFKKGRDSLLTLDQIEKLKDLGFKWKGPRLAWENGADWMNHS